MLLPIPVFLTLLPLIVAETCPAPNSCNPLLPSNYTFTAFTATRAQIESYTKRSVEALLKYPNIASGKFGNLGGWVGQNGWTNVAAYDQLRGTTVFKEQVSAAQDALAKSTGPGVPLVNEFNDDSGWAALANLRAYHAYRDRKYLDRTVAVWEYLNTQAVTQKDIDKGYLEGTKNPDNKIPASCNGKSMIGGVCEYFLQATLIPDWVNGLPHYPHRASSGGLNAVSTGLFALLSAELCETTKDTAKYCTKAYTSAQWLDRHMVRPDGLLWDNISAGSCKVTDWTFTYNAGLYISTYALLGSYTSNTTALALAERATKAAIKYAGWHAPNGILREAEGDPTRSGDGLSFKPVLVRALYRSFRYFKDDQLKSAVLEYINIQYFGLTQLAANSKIQPVEYGRNWTGPGYEVTTAHAQLAALDVLNAITINPKSAFLRAGKKDTPVIKEVKRASGC